MTDQWPTPRSLKDDPPPLGEDCLLFNGKYWSPRISLIVSVSDLIKDGYSHWLPMPPDPPQPKQAWEESWGEWFGINAIMNPPTSADAFKAGWNAALDLFDKEWRTDSGLATPLSELLNHLKAP